MKEKEQLAPDLPMWQGQYVTTRKLKEEIANERDRIQKMRDANERNRRRMEEAQACLRTHRTQLEHATRKGLARIDNCKTSITTYKAIIEQDEKRIEEAELEIEQCNSEN